MAEINLGHVKGERGPQGIQGLQGVQGIPGVQGPIGPAGSTPPISDSVTSSDSGVAASSKAVKTAYDRAASSVLKAGDTMTGSLTIQNGSLLVKRLGDNVEGRVYFGDQSAGDRYMSSTRTEYYLSGVQLNVTDVYTSDYAHRLSLKSPRPISVAGVGQLITLYGGSSFTLPSGGSWACFYQGLSNTGNVMTTYTNILAGGSVITVTNAAMSGFAWRIA